MQFSSQRQSAARPSGKPSLSHSTETELELAGVRPGAWQPEAQTEPHCTETVCSIHATFCLGHLRVPGFTVNPGPKSMQMLSGQGKLSVVVLTSFVVSQYITCRFQEKDGTDSRCIIAAIVCKKSLKLKNKWFLL